MLYKGDILDDKYEILTKIGKGGMSTVWLAMDVKLNRQWAIKEINKKSREYQSTVNEKKTLSEIEIMKRLDHPAFPRIVDYIDEPDRLCVVMDYIEGDTLLEILEEYGRQDEKMIAGWMLEVCDVLFYLHHQDPPIIYRDLKPANIMLNKEGHIKIIDFGIAREYAENQRDTLPLGTRGYASPEHFTKNTDERSDIYTVGATMYHLLTGLDPAEPPYEMRPIRTIDPKLSSGLEKIVLKATENDPAKRYQTVSELANAIASYPKLEEGHIHALEKKLSWYKRRSILAGISLLLGISLVISGTVLDKKNYSALIDNKTTNVEEREDNLKRAIRLNPKEKDAYIDLIQLYADDGRFTEKEAGEFQTIYYENREDLKKNRRDYAEINYSIGEAFLKYYTGEHDNSARAKLLSAEPYFKEAANNQKYEKSIFAGNYVFMAMYYRDFVMADDSLVSSAPGKDEYEDLILNSKQLCENIAEYSGDGSDRMTQITYDLILNLLDSQRVDMQKAGVEKDSLLDLVDLVNEQLGKAEVDEDTQKRLLEEVHSVGNNIEKTYKNAEKNGK